MHARLRAVAVLLVAAVAGATIVLASPAGGRPLTPQDECDSTTTTSTTSTTSTTEPTTTSTTSGSTSTTEGTIPDVSTTFSSFHPAVCETTTSTTRRATTTTTTAPSTTTTTADVSSEDPGSVEIPADQSRATVRPGGDVEVSTDVDDVGDDETPIEEGTELEAQVKVAEGDTEPLFTARATVQRDGTVSFDVTFPEDTEPGVYLVVIVLPGAKDANGNVLRRPRVAIATVVVRGRAGRSLPARDTKRDDTASRRFAGDDRYGTAEDLARSAFDGVLAPLLATGETYPDALAASYVAGAVRTPILLTPKDHLDLGVLTALTDLGATGVEIVGGPGAISQRVIDQLEAAGYATTRLGGVDRYDTARQIGTLIPPEGVGQLEDHGPTAIVVSGTSFADALTASPMSYSQGWPIFLTGADSLHAQARAGLEAMGIEHVVIVGGTDAVGEGAVDDIRAMGLTTERLAGVDRVDTSLAVAEFLFDRLDYDANDIALARGDDFPDALAAGPRGGDEVLPILLTPSADELGDAARTFIREHRDVLTDIEVIGGTAAVSDAVLERALMLAGVLR